jgi:hypothetical protein
MWTASSCADVADVAVCAAAASFAADRLFVVARSAAGGVDDNALSICMATSVRFAQYMRRAIGRGKSNLLRVGAAHDGSAVRRTAGHMTYRRQLAKT